MNYLPHLKDVYRAEHRDAFSIGLQSNFDCGVGREFADVGCDYSRFCIHAVGYFGSRRCSGTGPALAHIRLCLQVGPSVRSLG